MLEQACDLAARGHQPLMIEAVLRANGFPEAAEWIYQPHVHKELKDIADTARKQAVRLSTEPSGLDGICWPAFLKKKCIRPPALGQKACSISSGCDWFKDTKTPSLTSLSSPSARGCLPSSAMSRSSSALEIIENSPPLKSGFLVFSHVRVRPLTYR